MSSKQAFKLSFKCIGRDLNRHLPDQPDYFLCTTFSSFFQRMIYLIIDSLPRFDPALFDVTHISSFNQWSCFILPSYTVVLSLLNSLKSHSPLYHVPLFLFHFISPYFIGFITYIKHLSLITAVVPQSMKYSYIIPLLNKPNLDHSKQTALNLIISEISYHSKPNVLVILLC